MLYTCRPAGLQFCVHQTPLALEHFLLAPPGVKRKGGENTRGADKVREDKGREGGKWIQGKKGGRGRGTKGRREVGRGKRKDRGREREKGKEAKREGETEKRGQGKKRG